MSYNSTGSKVRHKRQVRLIPIGKLSKKVILAVVAAVFFSLLLNFFVSKKGWLKIIALDSQRKRIKREILALNDENDILRKRIKEIRYDPLYIEKIAREELGMVKPGETVYKLVPPKQ